MMTKREQQKRGAENDGTGYPQGNQKALFSRREDSHRIGRPSRRGQHCRAVYYFTQCVRLYPGASTGPMVAG
jgi:hypothetical protein